MIFEHSERFRKIIGRFILVYYHYSEESVYNLIKRRTPQPVFSGESFENGWLQAASSEQSEVTACDVI